ncbi:alanine racemase [Desulfarculales bacterium]
MPTQGGYGYEPLRGVPHGQALEFLATLRPLKDIRLKVLASHVAIAGDPISQQAALKTRRFAQVLAAARQESGHLADSSLSGSGEAMASPPQSPEASAFARLGIALYGGRPNPASDGLADLRPVMHFATRLLAMHRVLAGESVSYGATWQSPVDTGLGALPVSYSDGYPRALSNRGQLQVGGELAPMRGRGVHEPDHGELGRLPAVVDEVVLLGRQGGRDVSVDQLDAWAWTISYKITYGLGAANRRRFRLETF